jgi:hypothetical protein
MIQLHPEGCTDQSTHGAEHSHVNVNRIEISERTLSIFSLALASAAIVTACWAIHDAHVAEREARMYEYYTLEMDAKLIGAGVKKPDEAIAKRKE